MTVDNLVKDKDITTSQVNVCSVAALLIMMTSSNGNTFCVNGPLCREFPGHR